MASKPPLERPARIVWTDEEKVKIIRRAASNQQRRPDLSGLPLLRESLLAIGQDRRRKLIAMSQAPWFDEALATEIARRATARNGEPVRAVIVDTGNDPYVPHLSSTDEATKSIAKTASAIRESGEEWKSAESQFSESALAILTLIYEEVRSINLKLQPHGTPPVDMGRGIRGDSLA